MIISKDWWEEPPKEKHEFSTGSKVAAGTAAGIGLGTGAVLLATRGKAGKAVKVVRKAPKPKHPKNKTPKVIRNLRLAPQPTVPNGGVIAPRRPAAPPREEDKHLGYGDYVPELRATAPIKGRTSTPDNPVGPNVRRSSPQAIARQRKRDQEKVAAVTLQRKLKTAQESKAANEADLAALEGNKPPVTADGTPVTSPMERRAIRRENARIHGKPGRRPRRGPVNKTDADIIAKRILLDMQDEIFKASVTGERGDKRNTKYALMGLGGYVAGLNAGERIGARTAGVTWAENRRKANAKMHAYTTKKRAQILQTQGKVASEEWKPSLGEIYHVNRKVKGTKQLVRGGQIGGAVGTAAALGGYALYRHDKKKRRESPAMEAMLAARRAEEPVAKAFFRPKIKLSTGPGAMALKPVPKKPNPVQPYGGFVQYDAGMLAQKRRAAMKATMR